MGSEKQLADVSSLTGNDTLQLDGKSPDDVEVLDSILPMLFLPRSVPA
jgi:hypothetical protein